MAFETTDMTYSSSPIEAVNASDLKPVDLFPAGGKFFWANNEDGEAVLMMRWTPEDSIIKDKKNER